MEQVLLTFCLALGGNTTAACLFAQLLAKAQREEATGCRWTSGLQSERSHQRCEQGAPAISQKSGYMMQASNLLPLKLPAELGLS